MDDTQQKLPTEPEHLSPEDFDADELVLRDELDDRLRAAVAGYTEVPFGSIDCLASRLREANLKLQLSQLDWRVCSRKYKAASENDVTYSRIISHYFFEQGIILAERERLGRELWHLYRKSAAQKTDAGAESDTKPQKIKPTELFALLMRDITQEEDVMFLVDMENKYGLTESIGQVWCPVTGWVKKSDMSVVRIFPAQIGREAMGIIFGGGFEGDANGAENGLFLPPAIKYAFENYQVAIIPHYVEARPREYKFVVLEPTLLRAMVNEEMTFNELNGRRLIFKPGSDFGPNPRYIFFHFAVAMRLTSRKTRCPQEIPHGVLSELRGAWTDPTKIIAEDLLIGFVEVVETHREIGEEEKGNRNVSRNAIGLSRD
ncbi:hypothetical protein AJ78_01437 [Emergomyces pasteurianus Ep9510]|uniref:HNH nuclease domain-containing protein n=1 Tax=Emergomyces pasteurianus Ep9510 TaxID=1447872 RepID=A0A1J9PQ08_9EURO|nr:hypothetical protein AJ78_01437 [Emergomyces pasteurianus Ep9510]